MTIKRTISAYNDYNDSDNDGLNNYTEVQNGTDPNEPDSDNDGLNDGDEITNGTDPNIADYTLDLTYNSSKLSVTKIPNLVTYPIRIKCDCKCNSSGRIRPWRFLMAVKINPNG